MRISGPNGPTAATGKSSVRRSASGIFSLPHDDDASAGPSGTSGVATVSGIDALIALQGIESATDRRRRAVSRGKSALDALDDLKLAVLSGVIDPSAADRLRTTVLGLSDPSGDPELDRVLAEIELRVEVELAKMQMVSA